MLEAEARKGHGGNPGAFWACSSCISFPCTDPMMPLEPLDATWMLRRLAAATPGCCRINIAAHRRWVGAQTQVCLETGGVASSLSWHVRGYFGHEMTRHRNELGLAVNVTTDLGVQPCQRASRQDAATSYKLCQRTNPPLILHRARTTAPRRGAEWPAESGRPTAKQPQCRPRYRKS